MKIFSVLGCVLFCLVGTSAFGGQSYPASRFSGMYSLACDEVTLALTLSLSGSIGGVSGSWYDTIPVPMHCDGISDEERDALADEVSSGCQGVGFPEADCDDLGDEFATAAADYNNAVVASFPYQVKMTVTQTNNWWYWLWGIYPMVGNHYVWDDATQQDLVYTWNYYINNNDGVDGEFDAIGIALGSSASEGNFGCTTLAAAAISGRIYAPAGYTIDADWFVSENLVCAAIEGADWLLGTATLSLNGVMSGVKL